MGIPKDSIVLYETALKTDKYLLIANGSVDDAMKAEEILKRTMPETLAHHQ
jgi:hypothetical protein